MKFKVEFDTDNAAFEDMELETARILKDVAVKIESGQNEGFAVDINGNRDFDNKGGRMKTKYPTPYDKIQSLEARLEKAKQIADWFVNYFTVEYPQDEGHPLRENALKLQSFLEEK